MTVQTSSHPKDKWHEQRIIWIQPLLCTLYLLLSLPFCVSLVEQKMVEMVMPSFTDGERPWFQVLTTSSPSTRWQGRLRYLLSASLHFLLSICCEEDQVHISDRTGSLEQQLLPNNINTTDWPTIPWWQVVRTTLTSPGRDMAAKCQYSATKCSTSDEQITLPYLWFIWFTLSVCQQCIILRSLQPNISSAKSELREVVGLV